MLTSSAESSYQLVKRGDKGACGGGGGGGVVGAGFAAQQQHFSQTNMQLQPSELGVMSGGGSTAAMFV